MKFNLLKRKKNNVISSSNINKKTREKSLGRSMVEMLGVLAIIGVLSIGGIQGYTIAMRKYRANEIVNLLHKYAVVSYTSFQNYLQNHDAIVAVNVGGSSSNTTPMYYFENNRNAYGYSPCVSASPCFVPDFSDTDLGSLPSGVSGIFHYGIFPSVDEYGETTFYDENGIPPNEYVTLYVTFDKGESALCEEVLSALSGYFYVRPHYRRDASLQECRFDEDRYSGRPELLERMKERFAPSFSRSFPMN